MLHLSVQHFFGSAAVVVLLGVLILVAVLVILILVLIILAVILVLMSALYLNTLADSFTICNFGLIKTYRYTEFCFKLACDNVKMQLACS